MKINKWYPYVKNIRANFPTIKKKCWIIPFSSKNISGLESLFVPFLYYYFFLWNCQSLENIWMEFLLRPPMKIIQGWKFVNKDTFTLYKFLLTKASPHSNLIFLNKQLTLLYFILQLHKEINMALTQIKQVEKWVIWIACKNLRIKTTFLKIIFFHKCDNKKDAFLCTYTLSLSLSYLEKFEGIFMF